MSDRLGANQGAARASGSQRADNEIDAECGLTPVLPADARCLGCGYRLRELPSTICPECGRAFDPRDASTYRLGPHIAYWRRWARPPGVVHHMFACLLAVLALYGYSGPPGTFALLGPYLGTAVLLGLALRYAVHAGAVILDRSRVAEDRERTESRSAVAWLVLPLAVSIIISTAMTDWPLRLRFSFSQSAFDAAVARLSAREIEGRYAFEEEGKFIGLYYVSRCEMIDIEGDQKPDIIKFTTGGFLFDDWGFAYDPNGLPSGRPQRVLSKPWTVYYDSK